MMRSVRLSAYCVINLDDWHRQWIHSKNGCATLTHERVSFDCPKFDTLHTLPVSLPILHMYTCVAESYVC